MFFTVFKIVLHVISLRHVAKKGLGEKIVFEVILMYKLNNLAPEVVAILATL